MITAQSILVDVQAVDLQDPQGIRWPAADLVRHLNDGQNEIVKLKPSARTVTATFVPAAGAKQALPAGSMALIDIPRNTGGKRRAISRIDKQLLDNFNPSWESMRPATEVIHYMPQADEPRTFYIYPPAAVSGASVELQTSIYPAQIGIPPTALATSVTGTIDIPDEWSSALRDYVLFRAWSKDAEFSGNAALAQAHLQLFLSALGAAKA